MSRAQVEALVTLLEGLTLTDSGLVGSPLSLADAVRLVTPRDAVAPEEPPVCYLVVSGVDGGRNGIQGETRLTTEVLLHLRSTAPAEAVLMGAEVLDQLTSALLDAPGTVGHEVIPSGGRVVVDAERGRVACYLVVTATTLRG